MQSNTWMDPVHVQLLFSMHHALKWWNIRFTNYTWSAATSCHNTSPRWRYRPRPIISVNKKSDTTQKSEIIHRPLFWLFEITRNIDVCSDSEGVSKIEVSLLWNASQAMPNRPNAATSSLCLKWCCHLVNRPKIILFLHPIVRTIKTFCSFIIINVKKLNSLKQCLTATRPTSHN